MLAYKNGSGFTICPSTVGGQGNGLDNNGNTTVYGTLGVTGNTSLGGTLPCTSEVDTGSLTILGNAAATQTWVSANFLPTAISTPLTVTLTYNLGYIVHCSNQYNRNCESEYRQCSFYMSNHHSSGGVYTVTWNVTFST